MSAPKLSAARSRSELIASYAYGSETPYWALISQADRDKAASSGAAMPDGSYPIMSCDGDNSVDTAIHAVGRGDASHNAIRKHIMTRAKSLGCSSKIPDNWNDDGSLSDSDTATTHDDALAVVPPPAPDATAKPATDADSADAAVTDAITKLKAAVDDAIEAQKADPDPTDPKDEKVMAGLTQISDAVGQLVKDQAADAAEPEPDAKPTPPPAVAAAGPLVPPAPVKVPGGTAPNANPVDEQGNVDNGAVCTNPDCGHLASAHANTADGDNTGPCAMQGCACDGMNIDTEPNDSDDDSSGTGENDDDANPTAPPVKLAVPVADMPMPVSPANTPEPSLNQPPPVPGSENMGPAFTIPVGIIEGQPTGDGREIAAGALTWRTPPMPLMGLATETHDPAGFDQNDPAVICGRIDTLERVPGQGDTQVIMAKGFYLPNDDGQYFAQLTESMGRCGISADVAVQTSEVSVGDIDQDGWPTDMTEILTEGSIMGFTQVPFPAFEGAYIVLGDGTQVSEPIPQQTDAVAAAGIHFMTYQECEPCQQGYDLIVASGAPTRPPKSWFENPNFTEDDGRLVEILDRRGKRALGGKFACPITVTDQGRVYGHIAPWGVCHTGHTGQCILAPRSGANYAHFKRGQQITTAEGDKVRVGVITADTGHASTRPGVTATSAMAHYDNTALAVADVNIGEDEHGIWVAGALRPDADDAQIRKLTAASISGDWRNIGGQLELVAALAVNQPGFPLAVVAAGQHEALVAAGAGVMDRLKHPVSSGSDDPAARAYRAERHREKLQQFEMDTTESRLSSIRRRFALKT